MSPLSEVGGAFISSRVGTSADETQTIPYLCSTGGVWVSVHIEHGSVPKVSVFAHRVQ